MLLNPYRFGSPVVGQPYRDAVLLDAPAAYFRLAETSGPAVNYVLPTETGAATSVTQGVASLTLDSDDKAAGFLITGYITVPTLRYQYSSGFTYEVIIRINVGALSAGAVLGIMSKGNSGAYLRVSQSGSVGQGRLHWIRSRTQDLGQSSVLLSENIKYHVAVTVNSSGLPTFYVNGAPAGTGTSSTSMASTDDVLNIGSDYYGGSRAEGFSGVIDEIAIYDTALTSTRILAHAHAAGFA